MFMIHLSRGTETRCYSVSDPGTHGWELNKEENSRIVRSIRYTDWHRVERAIALIHLEAATLEREGWRVVG
jgi:hypothetical protein